MVSPHIKSTYTLQSSQKEEYVHFETAKNRVSEAVIAINFPVSLFKFPLKKNDIPQEFTKNSFGKWNIH